MRPQIDPVPLRVKRAWVVRYDVSVGGALSCCSLSAKLADLSIGS